MCVNCDNVTNVSVDGLCEPCGVALYDMSNAGTVALRDAALATYEMRGTAEFRHALSQGVVPHS